MKHALRNALARPWHLVRSRVAPRSQPVGSAPELVEALYLDAHDPEALIDLTRATSSYFYTFGPGGWSPFQGATSVLLGGGSRRDVRDYLAAYYDGFQPRTLAEAWFGPSAELAPLSALTPFDSFKPWRRSIKKISGHDGIGNQNFGPVTAARLEKETERVVGTCRSLEKRGYEPRGFVDGFIRGYALADGANLVFLVTSGVHRAAILSAMGAREIVAKFNPRMPRAVERASLPLWPHVRSGFCPPEAAAGIFDRHVRPLPDMRRAIAEPAGRPAEFAPRTDAERRGS
jgi:hypothetical protein